ncbi:MAG: FAD:protein FMN transferase [Kiritimatiellales bacterium]
MKKTLLIIFCLAALSAGLFLFRSRGAVNPSWEQPTMGTLCHITVAGSISKKNLGSLRAQIDTALADVNRRMSTWQNDTEISQFNRFQSLEKFPISPDFAEVVQSALAYAERTDGAFDPTVKPLVDHWGFGPGKDQDNVASILPAVGWQKVHLSDGALAKENKKLQLDLSAIAKGFGVDQVADVLRANGRKNFIVEIGGEIVADGSNRSGKSWRVGIESPEPGKAFGQTIFQTLEISGRAMATSGDYRNFRVREDGTRFSHIIDPRTGRPAESDVAAVTVLADRCMDADAIATSLCVMGSQKGLDWLAENPAFQAFFILHAPDGSFTAKSSPGFPKPE